MRGLQPEHGNVSALAFREPVYNKVRRELVVRRTVTAYFSGDTAIFRCAAPAGYVLPSPAHGQGEGGRIYHCLWSVACIEALL